MIGAVGYSEYLQRRTLPILRDLNPASSIVLVGTTRTTDTEHPPDVELVPRIALLNNSAIDCVYISSATGQHFRDCRAALDAGKNVLVEKPVCLTTAELDVLDTIARGNGLAVFECLSYPYHPAWETYHRLIHAHQWDGPVCVTATFCIPTRPHTDFRMQPGHGGSHADLGTYCLDALHRLGAGVDGLLLQPGPPTGGGTDVEGSAVGHGEIKGTPATYTAEWGFGTRYANRVTVSDDSTAIEIDRVFSLPPDHNAQIRARHAGKTVTTLVPAENATQLCLSDAIARCSDQAVLGVLDSDGIRRRVAALESMN
ncbi:Gfo/Idh/MocA family protein [Rhodococcus sp. HS-D2]|uniref:Gfo/Idh/MocA family protein n=1 Tax=Rhodococcus sp. HS-D2 TaxID=1384636 RepID=UPI0007D9799A|nr:Gfo/Idh/MocA family oxidoreductase [Rhodococcus sp. HS-D2]